MKAKIQEANTAGTEEASLKKVLNIMGLIIFGGLALTNITNPIPPYYVKEFLYFITGSTLIYYILLNMYFIGKFWRKVFYTSLILLCGGSLFMAIYLSV